MKKINLILLFTSAVVLFAACEKAADLFDAKKSKNTSDISVYPIFTVKGDKILSIPTGTEFSDPGVDVSEISEGGTDLNGTLVVKGTVDTNTPGLYFITYIAKNKYNYVDSTQRTVLVYQGDLSLNPDLTGEYKLGMGRMNITKSDVAGFWNATNINNPAEPIVATFADIGAGNYVILPGLYTQTGGSIGSFSGTAKLQTSGSIWFSISLNKNTPIVRKWNKV